MKLQVYARQTVKGWVLETADDSKDELAGPFLTEDELLANVEIMDAEIISTQVLTVRHGHVLTVRDRKSKDLFRIGDAWYRLVNRSPDGKSVLVDVVGTKTAVNLPIDTEISEISVLTLK